MGELYHRGNTEITIPSMAVEWKLSRAAAAAQNEAALFLTRALRLALDNAVEMIIKGAGQDVVELADSVVREAFPSVFTQHKHSMPNTATQEELAVDVVILFLSKYIENNPSLQR